MKNKAATQTTFTYNHGITSTIQRYEYSGNTCIRYDLTTVPATQHQREYDTIETMFVVDRNDVTPAHSTYPTGYDGRCHTCWLNYTHSAAYHQQNIASVESK